MQLTGGIKMKDYYYELKYVYGSHEIVHKFPANIDLPTLADYLKDFLKGCSWTEEQVNRLINGGE